MGGGILVFVTGQQEVLTLCSWLTRVFPKSLLDNSKVTNSTCDADVEAKENKQKDHDLCASINLDK